MYPYHGDKLPPIFSELPCHSLQIQYGDDVKGDINTMNTINTCFHADWSAGSAGHFIYLFFLYKHCEPRSRALMSLSSPDKPLKMTCANIVCYLFILNCGIVIDCSCKFRSNNIKARLNYPCYLYLLCSKTDLQYHTPEAVIMINTCCACKYKQFGAISVNPLRIIDVRDSTLHVNTLIDYCALHCWFWDARSLRNKHTENGA